MFQLSRASMAASSPMPTGAATGRFAELDKLSAVGGAPGPAPKQAVAKPHTRPWHQPIPARVNDFSVRASCAPRFSRASVIWPAVTSSQRHTTVSGASQSCQAAGTGWARCMASAKRRCRTASRGTLPAAAPGALPSAPPGPLAAETPAARPSSTASEAPPAPATPPRPAGRENPGSQTSEHGQRSPADARHLPCEEQPWNAGLLALIHDADQGTVRVPAGFDSEGHGQLHLRSEPPAEADHVNIPVDAFDPGPDPTIGVNLGRAHARGTAAAPGTSACGFRSEDLGDNSAGAVWDPVPGEDGGVLPPFEGLLRHARSGSQVWQPRRRGRRFKTGEDFAA